MTGDMRAVVQDVYGGPDVVQVARIAVPRPRANQVRVRVRATTVTPADCAFRSATPAATRLFTGIRRPKSVPGGAFVGEVDAVGAHVDPDWIGRRVLGQTGPSFGAHAEYVCVAADGVLARIGPAWSDGDAVAVMDGAMTALPFLRDEADLRPGQRLLVNGASGSIGAAAVQIGRYMGAHVTGVCSTPNLDLVDSLGAHEVIDYTAQAVTAARAATHPPQDVVFDAVGALRFSDCRALLAKDGIYLTTVPSPAVLWQSVATARPGGRRAKIAFTGMSMSGERLRAVLDLATAGALRPLVDRTYPLADIAEAHRYVDTRRKRGTVVVTV